MSKIASIETIKQVRAHPNADRLDLVKVLGYQCVTQKGLYKEGDIVIYIQPDSILPEEPWAEEYRKYSPKRIKAVKLRFEWSEGIIVSKDLVKDVIDTSIFNESQIGLDVSEMLNIKHYEPPMPQDLSAKGLLPFGIPKTDEERWENLVSVLPIGEAVDVTLKIDGQSWSAYYKLDQDVFGVLGRTMEYKLECGNRYTAQIARYDVENKLRAFCQKHNVSLCIRGESYGEGLQNFAHNPHSKEKAGLALFSVYLIDERRYARKGDPFYFDLVAAEMGLPTVEFVERDVLLTPELIQKYSADLNNIDNQPFEGVVINHSTYTREVEIENDGFKGIAKYNEPAGSFKIINKNYDARK
jgi:RNA ligase (TIGR02306 family)